MVLLHSPHFEGESETLKKWKDISLSSTSLNQVRIKIEKKIRRVYYSFSCVT